MARFVPNRNLDNELRREARYITSLVGAAKDAEKHAKALAPVDEGDYRDGIKVVIKGKEVFVSGTDWKSGFIEFGTNDTPIFAPLRRAVRAAGLKYKETR